MAVIGIMTAGGDCPGLNAVIRGVTTQATEKYDAEVVGFLNGWEGLMEGRTVPLDRDAVRGILQRGGTILGTSRKDPYVHGDGYASVRRSVEAYGVDVVVVVGGDGTLATALKLSEEGFRAVGVPKTIDNDIAATDVTFGFNTAVEIATEAIDRLTTTAEAHHRIMVVEVMGRTKGWIATYAGIASGADAILIPEVPYDLDEVASIIRARHRRGRNYSVVVVAEGVEPPSGAMPLEQRTDAFGFARLGGVSYQIAPMLEEITGFETRVMVLGHLQRGGTPTAYDRVLGTRLGVAATDAAVEGDVGTMVAVKGEKIVRVPLADACSTTRGVDPDIYEAARIFFG